MSRMRGAYVVALVPILLGVSLHLYEHVALSDHGFSPGFFLWAVMPYGLCIVGLALSWNPYSIGFAAAVVLTFDLLAHYAVFIHPTSSTAPLVLLFMPLYDAVLWIPAALLLAHSARRWLIGRARHP
jgi:phosphoglycerol transferase MdoB-like AlkP superfamily enzyme